MVKIKLSRHSKLKIQILQAHGFQISEQQIENIIQFPDKVDIGYKKRTIAQKRLDDKHVVRVVYEQLEDHILVITLYPGRRTRYE